MVDVPDVGVAASTADAATHTHTRTPLCSDAYLTAHFEVPGEMFELAMEAKRRGAGVVGSTQNILDFIVAR